MVWKILFFALTVILSGACVREAPEASEVREEIRMVESAFNAAVAEKGIHQGFLDFAADDAILIRNSQAIEGKAAIASHYSKSSDTGQILTWSPRKIEVARSGELAYSFGDFTYIIQDSLDHRDTLTGNFCTIWKMQPDGSWKFVVD
ncbi:MAG: DUF4440 domain-containing protein [Saprospiraceae bacterium]|nr:DUF4440 domain-containing protein [Saprospiraceae bacterium]